MFNNLILGGKIMSSAVKSAIWSIEGQTYNGVQIAHNFETLGDISFEVTATTFENSATETEIFTVTVVIDISDSDPVRTFIYPKSDGSYDVLVLFSKERVRYAQSNTFYYNGTLTDWQQTVVSSGNKNYIINKDGVPEKTSDVGMYIGIGENIKQNGLYNVVLIHDSDVWADISGSAYVGPDNPGMAWFYVNNGQIIPAGKQTDSGLPGLAGGDYFRFTQENENLILYFKLDQQYTESAFAVRQQDGGYYSDPIKLWPVENYNSWGQMQIPLADATGSGVALRYGPDKSQPTVFSANMKESFFYDSYFKNLRLSVANL